MRKEAASKVDDVYGRLKRRIVMSEMLPGQQLVELDLAGSLGCSQSTVREALLRLREDGLIVRQGYRGTSVTSITPVESQLFLELRTMLEVRAARLSLQRLKESDVAVLSGIVAQMEAAAESGDGYAVFEKDLAFHMQLFEIADLPALTPVLMRCSLYNHRNKISQTDKPRTLLETARRHRNIIEALEAGNPDLAEEIVRHHVASVFGATDPKAAAGGAGDPMTAPMRRIFLRKVAEEGALPDIASLPPPAGRKQFERVNRRWNRIERARFDIAKFRIPSNPLSTQAARAIPALRIAARSGRPIGTILYLHGGGWTFGGVDTHLGVMARLAESSGCAVVGIDYALSPEAVFPAALNECLWAWRFLRSQPGAGGPWFVAGDSSGANLGLAMLLDLRNLGEAGPGAAALVYGVYSDSMTRESNRLFGQGDFGLTTTRMSWYVQNYCGAGCPGFARARAFPLEADLNGLPPLLVAAAELDPLRDDSIELVKKLAQTDTPFEFKKYAGVIHGFLPMGDELPEAATAVADIAGFFRMHARS